MSFLTGNTSGGWGRDDSELGGSGGRRGSRKNGKPNESLQ